MSTEERVNPQEIQTLKRTRQYNGQRLQFPKSCLCFNVVVEEEYPHEDSDLNDDDNYDNYAGFGCSATGGDNSKESDDCR